MKDKKFDVVALGELLIDFTQNGISQNGNWMLEANPGGAPCNVLAMLQKLGHKTSFIGKVGDDMFGNMLKERIAALGIGTENLVISKSEKTTLAFVRTAEDGDRSFSFYRNNSADCSLKKEEIDFDLIASSKILHYGTLSMTNEPVNSATEVTLEFAKKSDVLLSFDPNLRMMLWDNESHAKERILYGISMCNILKIAEEELEFVTGKPQIKDGILELRKKFNIPLITVTRGKNGCVGFFDNGKSLLEKTVPTFTNVKTIDTTGAGDTFCACILHEILQNGYNDFTEERLEHMLVFANAASSLITTKKGALCVMPNKEEVEKLILQK